MKFYVIQLFQNEYKEDIILAMTSANIMQGTCLDGDNLDYILNQDFPIFTSLFKMKEDKERASSIFFGFSEEETLKEFRQLLDAAGIDNKNNEVFRIGLMDVTELN